jgi:hypothetical protein
MIGRETSPKDFVTNITLEIASKVKIPIEIINNYGLSGLRIEFTG